MQEYRSITVGSKGRSKPRCGCPRTSFPYFGISNYAQTVYLWHIFKGYFTWDIPCFYFWILVNTRNFRLFVCFFFCLAFWVTLPLWIFLDFFLLSIDNLQTTVLVGELRAQLRVQGFCLSLISNCTTTILLRRPILESNKMPWRKDKNYSHSCSMAKGCIQK